MILPRLLSHYCTAEVLSFDTKGTPLRIGLFSDCEGNARALEASLIASQAHVPDVSVCAGDIVNCPFSPDPPVETIALSREYGVVRTDEPCTVYHSSGPKEKSMYLPAAFRESRQSVQHEVIQQYSFGTLVSRVEGELFATHLPFLLVPDRGPHGMLLGHVARANPHWRRFGGAGTTDGSGDRSQNATDEESLVIFEGPHAYISPSWYATEVAVPTWNYVVVHAYGRPRVLSDPAVLHRLLGATVDTYEGAFEAPWSLGRLPEGVVEKMAEAIVGFEIPISRLEGKFKLNQNRSAADRRGVISALQRSGDPLGMAVAELMERRERDRIPST
jgi:transcriptional regulator